MDAPSKRTKIGWISRFVWSMFGPMLLVFMAITIVTQEGNSWFTVRDLLFAVILLAIIFCRWTDFRHGEATDSYGKPVTVSDLRRYICIWAMAGAAFWVAANLIGIYLI